MCLFLLVGTDTGAVTYIILTFGNGNQVTFRHSLAWQALSVVCIALLAPWIAIGRSKKKIAVGIFLYLNCCRPINGAKTFRAYVGIRLGSHANGTDLIWWILLVHSCALVAIGSLGFVFITSMAMEIVEDVEKKTGRREEGLLGTVNALIHKINWRRGSPNCWINSILGSF